MGTRAEQTKAAKRIREAERAVLAQAVAMVHQHERAQVTRLHGAFDAEATREQWRLWDELRRRVSVLDQAEAEEEARNG